MRGELTRTGLVVGLIVAGFGFEVPAAAENAGDRAGDRFGATVKAAVEYSPALQARLADLTADEAGANAEGGAGTPWAEWQSEGIGFSGGREANAQDTLRLGMPFNWPRQASRARRLNDAASQRSEASIRGAVLAAARFSGEEWLRLAAHEERLRVVSERLMMLDRAVDLQRKRLELGEISGTELMQLEMAQAAEASKRAALEADAEASRKRLSVYCGPRCAFPMIGDLTALQENSRSHSAKNLEPIVDETPDVRSARSEEEVALARAKLLASSVWGRPAVTVEWEHFPSWEGLPSYDAMGLQLTVPLPIGKAGRRQREEAVARAAAAAARSEATRLDVQAWIEGAATVASGAESRLDALAMVLEGLSRAEHSLAEQFRLGATSYLVFIDGLSRLDGIQLEAIDARESLLSARLQLAVALDDSTLFPLPVPETDIPEAQP